MYVTHESLVLSGPEPDFPDKVVAVSLSRHYHLSTVKAFRRCMYTTIIVNPQKRKGCQCVLVNHSTVYYIWVIYVIVVCSSFLLAMPATFIHTVVRNYLIATWLMLQIRGGRFTANTTPAQGRKMKVAHVTWNSGHLKKYIRCPRWPDTLKKGGTNVVPRGHRSPHGLQTRLVTL